MNEEKVILKVQRLRKYFPVKESFFSSRSHSLKAVNNVSFDLRHGETLGLVGESGCGKTTLGRLLLRLYEPDEGRIWLNPEKTLVENVSLLDAERIHLEEELNRRKARGERSLATIKKKIKKLRQETHQAAREHDIPSMDKKHLRSARHKIQLIFQDPWASLNPHQLVKDIISEGPKEFDIYRGPSLNAWVMELLDKVGMPSSTANRYPHEFSGGQRQRICIARALSLSPSILICDEPVSALDVSIQAQVLNLLISLQEEFNFTYLFIAHDLSIVEYISDRVAVMYLGKIVETARAKEIYQNPRHPYTQNLLSAIPVADPDIESKQVILEGEVPSPINSPKGCSFHTRCPNKTDMCTKESPVLEKNQNGHLVACHNPLEKQSSR